MPLVAWSDTICIYRIVIKVYYKHDFIHRVFIIQLELQCVAEIVRNLHSRMPEQNFISSYMLPLPAANKYLSTHSCEPSPIIGLGVNKGVLVGNYGKSSINPFFGTKSYSPVVSPICFILEGLATGVGVGCGETVDRIGVG